ncbi:hypothetical protein R1flu_006402 [Riccia fluitans]|uniref:mitogen-activated protein kinase kinase kinase n=1 Tax=Riccia fluitans TaxID=41844 RepID=A0ABD1YVW3_9MARC
MLSCAHCGSPSPVSSCFPVCVRNPFPKMPWWGKSTSKEVRKGSKDGGLDGGQHRSHSERRHKGVVEDESRGGRTPRYSLDGSQEPGSPFATCSRSPSPSTPSTRCPSFKNDGTPQHKAQPLPLPCAPLGRTYSGTGMLSQPNQQAAVLYSYPSMPLPSAVPDMRNSRDLAEGDHVILSYPSCSNSSVSSLGSVEVAEVWPSAAPHSRLRPYHDAEIPEQLRPNGSSLGSVTPKHSRKNSKQELSRPSSPLVGGQTPSSSPKRCFSPTKRTLPPINMDPIGHNHRFLPSTGSAPDSSMSSPARSPRRAPNSEHAYTVMWGKPEGFPGSAQGSSPGSGHNSGHDSSGGDPGQMVWNHNKRSPERSPIPSPRQRSPGPSSRVQSGTVSPLHPRAGVPGAPDSPTSWHEDAKTSAHPLPLPPQAPGGPPLASSPSVSAIPSPTAGRSGRGDIMPGNAPTRWQKGKLLGTGTFGNVYVGFNSDIGSFCAMKEVLLVSDDSKSKESVKQLGQEIALLSKLRHQNIVQYIGTEALEDRLCIYLEYVSGGSIHKLLQDYGQFKEPVIRSFTRQILSGLAYLHNMNTVHRDVKGANILVDTQGNVKLADFGMAKHITAQSFPLSFKGSPYWMAPEVIKHTNGYDLAVDIWSLGCTVLEMATAKPPWSQYEGVAAMFKIGNSKELPSIPDTLSPEGKDFVRQCLQRNPAERPTAQELLEHPFVRNAPNDGRIDGNDAMAATAGNIRSLGVGTRHDSEVQAPLPPARTRGHFSPTSELSPRNPPLAYGPSTLDSMSPSNQSRRLVHNGLSSMYVSDYPHMQSGASSPLNIGYGSPHGSSHGSSQLHTNVTSGAVPNFSSDIYLNQQRSNGLYATSPSGYSEPARAEFQWSNTHRNLEGSPRRRPLNVDVVENLSNDILGMALGRVPQDSEEDIRRLYIGNGNLVEHVSQQLLRKKQVPPHMYLAQNRPTSPSLSRTSSELSH